MGSAALHLALAAAVIAPGCTSTQAPIARRVGMVASLGGVVGLIGAAGMTAVTDDATPFVGAFSLVSAVGILMFAAGELTGPAVVHEESTEDKHHRWARILTERAFRYAREGNCRRVRRVEKRVNFYDRAFHDAVFMRDEAIAKCMSTLVDPPIDGAPAAPGDGAPVDGAPSDAPPDAPVDGAPPPVTLPPTLVLPPSPPPPTIPPPSP